MNEYLFEDRFDDLARQVAGGLSRRSLLKIMLGTLLAGLGFSGSRRALATAGEAGSVYLPIVLRPGEGCTQVSVCPEKIFCSEDPPCVCLESAEGEPRCGRAPACASPRCRISDDCAFMGAGYFCDVPFSGCCGDNHLQRCIGPCNSGCPPRRECPTGCCHISKICIDGACQPCSLDRICGDICCPEGQWCVDGACVPDTTGCPECGTCYRCFSNGACFAGSCPGGCVEGALCRKATLDPTYQMLADYLTTHGFSATGESNAATFIVQHLNEPVRDARSTRYAKTATGETASLLFLVEATDAVDSFVLVTPPSGPSYVLRVSPQGEVVRIDVPPEGNVAAGALSSPGAVRVEGYNRSTTGDCRECRFICTAAVSVECALVAALICGPAAPICAAIAAGLCNTSSQPCDLFCNSMLGPVLESDVENCGSCGNLCQSPNDQCCSGQCSDSLHDPQNCGRCGNVCPTGQICCQGRCEAPDECCPYPQTPCQGYCCPHTSLACAPEGGCCPPLRLCADGMQCCEVGEQCITRPDQSSFCCAASQACPKSMGGPLVQCCPDGTRCVCNLAGCSCRN